ncbi:MAG: polyprenyl synthetase family protein [Acidimicrobiales bacterium]|nr:polyprenyl synthetase family protein [Acidimicrobiales bacterium]
MTTPAALTAPVELTEQRLTTAINELRSEWQQLDPLLAEIADRLASLVLAGGKRIRPAMAYWGHVGAGGEPTDPALANLCAAVELLQGFALFHDDVMDGSETRRGKPTVHIIEAQRHEDGNWRGEARRFGEAVAILAGDISLVVSDVLLADAPPAVRSLWNDLRVEVNLGQFLDVVSTARANISPSTADLIVEYKTARYTIVRPLQMGAALAGREDLLPHLAAVGTPLGVAFQLRDDLLGAFGDAEITGKPVGDDLIEGKPTPLLADARARATPDQLTILDHVGSADAQDYIPAIQAALTETGAVTATEARIDTLTDEALAELASDQLAPAAVEALSSIATFLAGRTH